MEPGRRDSFVRKLERELGAKAHQETDFDKKDLAIDKAEEEIINDQKRKLIDAMDHMDSCKRAFNRLEQAHSLAEAAEELKAIREHAKASDMAFGKAIALNSTFLGKMRIERGDHIQEVRDLVEERAKIIEDLDYINPKSEEGRELAAALSKVNADLAIHKTGMRIIARQRALERSYLLGHAGKTRSALGGLCSMLGFEEYPGRDAATFVRERFEGGGKQRFLKHLGDLIERLEEAIKLDYKHLLEIEELVRAEMGIELREAQLDQLEWVLVNKTQHVH